MKINLKLFILLILASVLTIFNITAQAETINSPEFEYYIGDDNRIVLTKYCGFESEVTVPESIDGYMVSSTEGTFANNKTIEKVCFQSGITTIGSETFLNCSNLKEVYVSDSIEILEYHAFLGTALTSITLPKSTHYIGAGCFYGCTNLKFVKSEAESLWISQMAFYNSGLEVMQLPQAPHYFDNSFSQECIFSYNPIATFLIQHEPLGTIFNFISQQPIAIQIQLIILIILIVCAVLYLLYRIIKRIRIILGKDNYEKYKNYNNACKTGIDLHDDFAAAVMFKKRRHKNARVLAVILIIYLLGWVEIFIFLIQTIASKIQSIPIYLLLNLVIFICGFILYVLATYLLIKVYCKISCVIHEKFLSQRHSSRSKIRKIRKGR